MPLLPQNGVDVEKGINTRTRGGEGRTRSIKHGSGTPNTSGCRPIFFSPTAVPPRAVPNAKPLLLTAANSIESYWTWRSTQRVSGGGGGGGGGDDETSENGLVTKVKADLRNGRIVDELW